MAARVTLDDGVIARLVESLQPIEVCDSTGKVVGFFRPRPDPTRFGPLDPQISEEELRRREQSSGPWHTTDEVVARLRKSEGA